MNDLIDQRARLPARHRMWLWIWGTVLGMFPLMGICFQLARISDVPLIVVFAPAVLAAHFSGRGELSTAYWLMPVQCVVYGLFMARAEYRSRRVQGLVALLAAHALLVLIACMVTGGSIAG